MFRDEFVKRRNQSIKNLCGEMEPPSIGKSDECQRNEENFRLHRHEEKKRKEKREHQQSVPTNKRDSFGKEVWRLPSYVSGGKEKEYKCSGERDNPRSNTASYRHPNTTVNIYVAYTASLKRCDASYADSCQIRANAIKEGESSRHFPAKDMDTRSSE